jgi:hypothetical protein
MSNGRVSRIVATMTMTVTTMATAIMAIAPRIPDHAPIARTGLPGRGLTARIVPTGPVAPITPIAPIAMVLAA